MKSQLRFAFSRIGDASPVDLPAYSNIMILGDTILLGYPERPGLPKSCYRFEILMFQNFFLTSCCYWFCCTGRCPVIFILSTRYVFGGGVGFSPTRHVGRQETGGTITYTPTRRPVMDR